MNMNWKKLFTISIVIGLLTLISCKTYYIPTSSLIEQFRDIDSTDFKKVWVAGPTGDSYSYLANPIENIKCIDKNNNPVELANSPSIEMRVTQNNGKKTIFYFDRIYLDDSLLYGIRSRFIPSIDKTIPLENIVKTEVQDGKKNFKYKKK
jgi:hypothetical protein